jgi:hypothetical protein
MRREPATKDSGLRDLYENLRMRTEAIPGVRTATLARITPLGGARWNQDIRTPTYQVKPGEWNVVDQNAVSPRFFETLGIPILLGRDFGRKIIPRLLQLLRIFDVLAPNQRPRKKRGPEWPSSVKARRRNTSTAKIPSA